MFPRNKIELLAPAKSADVGIEAIYHGADAVYIGGPKFGARVAAGNSIQDIERLVKVAHTYYAKVFVALNTILTDAELLETEKLINQLYEAGVDALIVQDMGITQLHLPPISLHASTQMDNRTPAKVRFLQDAGFDQVVLARELSFDEIRTISSQTTVRLEAFVHGALCVSYSGQCYLSHAMCGRSANRGACAQFCRLPYTLHDADGKVIAANQHLLSLRDMNQSAQLGELIAAGVSSLKIEGRLKDVDYVKNVTAFYRQQLDDFLEKDNPYSRASSGSSVYTFTPVLEKSFNRTFTNYFTKGRQQIGSFVTPKSQGEPFGVVSEVGRNFIRVKTDKTMSNGDGFCFVNRRGEFMGFKANRVEGNQIFPLNMPQISVGTRLNRNQDCAFDRILSKPSADRRIAVDVQMTRSDNGFVLSLTDVDGICSSLSFDAEAELAKNAEKSVDTIKTQLSKLGNTPFSLRSFDYQCAEAYFIPASVLADWRRSLVDAHLVKRENQRVREDKEFPETSHPFVSSSLDFRGNVYNKMAQQFYRKHGVEKIEPAFEANQEKDEVALMTCRHCIRFSLGLCTKTNRGTFREPFFLDNQQGAHLRLHFDCKNCEMQVIGKLKNN